MKRKIVIKSTPNIVKLNKIPEKELRALANIAESPEGKVLLTIIDNYIYNQMVNAYKIRSGSAEQKAAELGYFQGCGAGPTYLRSALMGAADELGRREDGLKED